MKHLFSISLYAPIRILFCLLVLGSICGACADEETADVPSPVDNEDAPKVGIQFGLSDYYEAADGWETRTDANLTAALAGQSTKHFADSTTLWVLVEKGTQDATSGKMTYTPMDSSLNVSYAIMTVTNADGTQTSDLVPCTVDENGKVLNTQSTLLYLQAGYYRIRAISPALKLHDNGTKKNVVTVSNGMTLFASYDACSLTAPLELTPTNFAVTDVIQRVNINPLVHQTAQLRFTIVPATPAAGESQHIYSIRPMEDGCEIAGLQATEDYNWMANNPEWILRLNEKQDTLTIHADDFETVSDTEITCQADVLPTSVEATTIYVNFNLRINGVPTQYMTSISDCQLNLGFRYPYTVRVTQSGDVSIASWVSVATSVSVPTATTQQEPQTSTPAE